MKTSDTIFELVQKYLDKEMSAGERLNFEQQLKTNPDLAAELKLHKEVAEAITDKGSMELRSQLQKIEKEYSGKGRVSYLRWYWAAAASIVLLLGLTYLFFFVLNKPMNDEKLFAQYYQPYETTYSVRSAEGDSLKLVTDAYRSYDLKDYKGALALFKQCITKFPENIYLHFYAGISCIETGDNAGALKYFDEVIAQNSNLMVEQAAWYKALCLLKMKKDADAKTMFKQMTARGGFYKPKAEEILKEMGE